MFRPRARRSPVPSFANGVMTDQAGLTCPWSNRQTEGQISKLNRVKRQMHGRGRIDPLQARVIEAIQVTATKAASEPSCAPTDSLLANVPLRSAKEPRGRGCRRPVCR